MFILHVTTVLLCLPAQIVAVLLSTVIHTPYSIGTPVDTVSVLYQGHWPIRRQWQGVGNETREVAGRLLRTLTGTAIPAEPVNLCRKSNWSNRITKDAHKVICVPIYWFTSFRYMIRVIIFALFISWVLWKPGRHTHGHTHTDTHCNTVCVCEAFKELTICKLFFKHRACKHADIVILSL